MPPPPEVTPLPFSQMDYYPFLHPLQRISDKPLPPSSYTSKGMKACLPYRPMSFLPSDLPMLYNSSMDIRRASLPVQLSQDSNEYTCLGQSNTCPCLQ